MKREYKIAQIAISLWLVLFLAGCSREQGMDEAASQGAKPIEFSNFCDASRAEELGPENLSSMGLYAFHTGSSKMIDLLSGRRSLLEHANVFMYNQEVARTQTDGVWSDWQYSPRKYWPASNEEYLSFLGFSPYNVINREESAVPGQFAQFSYTMSPIAIYNEDLLWCNGVLDQTRESGVVNFNFKHSMCRIILSVRVISQIHSVDERYYIDDVYLDNIKDHAAINYTVVEDAGEYIYKPVWGDLKTHMPNYTLTATQGHVFVESGGDKSLRVIEEEDGEGFYDSDSVMAEGKAIFVIPQQLEDDATITLRTRYYNDIADKDDEHVAPLIYQTMDIPLKAAIGAFEQSTTVHLRCTVDLSDPTSVLTPMSLYATIRPRTVSEMDSEIEDNIVIYSENNTIGKGAHTWTFYSSFEQQSAPQELKVVYGSTEVVPTKGGFNHGVYKYTANLNITEAVGSQAKVKVVAPRRSGATVTKVFNLEVE